MIRILLIFLLGPWWMPLWSQTPLHDACTQALTIQVGAFLPQEDNRTATTTPSETPEAEPVTCIKTFENDLWYQFTTEAEYTHYEVVIDPIFCNTPAGLQAMVIRAEDCDATTYEYKACVNPYAEASISMVFREEEAGVNYLIYVDGYDGTVCSFRLRLNGHQGDPREPREIGQEQQDYSGPPPTLDLEDFQARVINNEVQLNWTAATEDATRFFLVQRVYRQGQPNTYGKNLATIEAVNTVGADLTASYEYIDQRAFLDEETYCYRIVSVDAEGNKAYADITCVEIALNEDFFISPVYPSDQPDLYVIKFRNFRKQDLKFSVLDEEQQYLKGLTRTKEPKGDGTITINMADYPAGIYFLAVEGKSESFLRKFMVEK